MHGRLEALCIQVLLAKLMQTVTIPDYWEMPPNTTGDLHNPGGGLKNARTALDL